MKYYVVWAGHDTGVFDSWEECRLQTEGFPGARFKAFSTREAAVAAYRNESKASDLALIASIASHPASAVNYEAFPEININSIAVDAGCRSNPGPVDYRGVDLATGTEIFHVGPLAAGTNNMGEFLAIVHALALLHNQGRPDVTVYSDSRTAMAWVRNRKAKTTLTPTPQNAPIRGLVARAEAWLAAHPVHNPVVKWDTKRWGEIPADFGRK